MSSNKTDCNLNSFDLSQLFNGNYEFVEDSENEWIAVKPSNFFQKNKNQDGIVNIVSISVENEKIIIVCREHNRVATDDENKHKTWYGIFSIEQFYSIYQQVSLLDQNIDIYFPEDLRPKKGFLNNYFSEKISNELCNSITTYLNKCFESLGLKLYIDIFFNGIESDQYFEIYSEFNLKRLENNINKILNELFPIIKVTTNQIDSKSINNFSITITQKKLVKNDLETLEKMKKESLNEKNQNITCIESSENYSNEKKVDQEQINLKEQLLLNLKILMDSYSNDEKQIDILLTLYNEYYNNLLKPLIDCKELANMKLLKYEKKVQNQEKTAQILNKQSEIDALNQLKQIVKKTKEQIDQVSINIDTLSIEHKQKLIDLNKKQQTKLENDRNKFMQKNLDLTNLFDILTEKRREKIQLDMSEKIVQLKNLQLKINERKLENLINSIKNNHTNEINDLKIKINKLKMLILNEEESVMKKQLKKLKNKIENEQTDTKNDRVIKLFDVKELSLCQEETVFLNSLINNNISNDFIIENSDEEDEYDDSKFHDTFEDEESLIKEQIKEKLKNSNEINQMKKKILEIGSNKSALRIDLQKLLECEKVESKIEKENESVKNQTFEKSILMKKQEDDLQRQMFVENRKKALQRLREYKKKHEKDTKSILTSGSLLSISTQSLSLRESNPQKPKKVYVPKSKQKILPPPNEKLKKKIIEKNKNNEQEQSNSFSSSSKSPPIQTCLVPPVPPPLPAFLLSPSLSMSSVPLPPPLPSSSVIPSPPTPPPLLIHSIPSPPPPPSLNTNNLIIITKNEQSNHKIETKKEFDLNEIKNFTFKNKHKAKNIVKNQDSNPWDNLMNQIRSNAGENLKKVSIERKNRKSSAINSSGSNLINDLNLILSQRQRFFQNDEDDDDSMNEFELDFFN